MLKRFDPSLCLSSVYLEKGCQNPQLWYKEILFTLDIGNKNMYISCVMVGVDTIFQDLCKYLIISHSHTCQLSWAQDFPTHYDDTTEMRLEVNKEVDVGVGGQAV